MSSPTDHDLGLSQALMGVIQELGFKALTPIQVESIPVLLAGKDLIAQSQTGSGKTAAFALPVLDRLDLRSRRTQTLVLCPTRELCAQVAREIRKFGRKHSGLHVLVLSGGLPFRAQMTSLMRGSHIVVGTPGRVLDHLRRNTLDLSALKCLVLDEADRMLEMGFQEEMEAILSCVPEARQTALFSATYPEEIETLSQTYQKNPVRVTIPSQPEQTSKIRQVLYEVPREEKEASVLQILQTVRPDSVILFCNLKSTVVELARSLKQAGIQSAGIHGDLDQIDRDRIMAQFRNKSLRVLVATDVAARGIDVENVDLVVNFDLPINKPDVYVHRVGRTGRAGKSGLAVSLATPRDLQGVSRVEEYIGFPLERERLPSRVDSQRAESVPLNDANMATLFIGGGRKQKVRPGDILGALTGEAGGIAGSQVGKIEIHDHFSYVAVAKALAEIVLHRLREGQIKGRKFRVELVR